jgi:hypothetical protein
MPPVGLLAIIALGLVLTFTLPERVADASRYGVVRTENRYRGDMRVIRETAARIRPGSDLPTVEVPSGGKASSAGKRSSTAKGPKALAPRQARASIRALGGSVMARPPAPLDRAANVARRQMVTMRRDRAQILARRAAQARRRAAIAVGVLVATLVTWGTVAFASWPVWSGVAATAGLAGVAVAGRTAVRAQTAADARLLEVAREVATAAAATAALQRITSARVAGFEVAPSDEETQAIAIVTARIPALAAAPTPFPSSLPLSLPLPLPDSIPGPGVVQPVAPLWSPDQLPLPSYALKSTAPAKRPRPISDDDLARGTSAATSWGERHAAAVEARAAAAPEPEASTQTLDDILARRRRTA